MGIVLSLRDGLTNLIANLGTGRDKAAASTYVAPSLTYDDLLNAYRGAWLPRKIVDIPALDATRKWRDWQADGPQITAIEREEKRLFLREKVNRAMTAARLFGGSAIFIGTGEANVSAPLELDRIGKGGLKYAPVLSMRQLAAGELDLDPASEWFNQPSYYWMPSATGEQVRIHPSRLALFQGAALPEDGVSRGMQLGWGDSVLIAAYDAVRNADATMANVASLVFETKVDVISVPGLMNHMRDPRTEQMLTDRFRLAAMMKGINGTLLLDGGMDGRNGETYEQKSASFSSLDSIMDRFLQVVAGAADIPMTRLFGQAPAGMNATGVSDMKNYHDRIQAIQEIEMTPAMHRLDEALIRSALGSRPDNVFYTWSPLEQMNEKEKADILKTTSDAARAIIGTGGLSPELLPVEALSDAFANALIEQGVLPGLEAALKEFGRLADQDDDPEGMEAAMTVAEVPTAST